MNGSPPAAWPEAGVISIFFLPLDRRGTNMRATIQRAGGAAMGLGMLMVAALAGVSRGAVITDSTLTFGADAIDKQASAQDVSFTPSNATPQATLEAIDTFGAIHSFSGFTDNATVTTVNYINFTDTARPDLRFSLSGTYNGGSGKGNSSSSLATSANAFYSLYGDDANTTANLAIDFGTYDTTTSTFTAGNAPVRAAGFAIGGVHLGDLFTVQFLNAAGQVLSTQSINATTTPDTNQSGAYFGLDTGVGTTPSTAISSMTIAYTHTGVSSQRGLDDVGFSLTVVPEPASLGLIGGLGMMLIRRRRRAA
jgi:hypothetical protein